MEVISHQSSLSKVSASTKLFGSMLVLALPVLGLVNVELVGQLYVHEILLAALFLPLLHKRYAYFSNSDGKKIVLFMLVWLAAQMLTDLIRATPPEDFLRGWAKISFFLVGFVALACLLVNERRVLLWISVSVIPWFYRPYLLFADNPDPLVLWKFGIGPALLLFWCLPFIWKFFKKPNQIWNIRAIAWLHFAFGLFSFYMNARSFAGLSILTGVLILIFVKYRGCALSVRSVAMSGVVLFILINLLAGVYSYGASSGFFGSEAQEKYASQVKFGGGVLNILLGGRSESLVSTIAIGDSPIIGHGSWAKNYKYTFMLAALRRDFSEVNEKAVTRDALNGLIPSHSYLLGAWVESGIVGGAFWIFILLWVLLRVLPAAWSRGDVLGLYVVMSLPLFFWNVFFSPFGANVRVDVAGFLAICVFVFTRKQMSTE